MLGEGSRSPAIDVYDKKDRLVLKGELPGMEKKDVSVKVDGDVLIIRGETRKERGGVLILWVLVPLAGDGPPGFYGDSHLRGTA